MLFSRGSFQPRDQTQVSRIQVDSLPAEPAGKPMTTAVGGPSLLQGNLPSPGIEPGSSALQADPLPTELSGKPEVLPHVSRVTQYLSFCDWLKSLILGIPWESGGWDSTLSLLGAWAQSLARELRSCKPHGAVK